MRSKRDVNYIAQLVFDEESKANKVKLVDTEISMELDANDGDSITTHPVKLIASVLGVASPADDSTDIIPPLDASSLSVVRIDTDGSGLANVYASPTDTGNYFYLVGASGITHNICARRIKVVSVNAVGDVHLVGKS